MKTKNKLLTDEQLEIIEVAVEFLLKRQLKKETDTKYRISLMTALQRWYTYNAVLKKWPNGHICVADFKVLIGKNSNCPIKFDDVYKCGPKKYISLDEARKKIEAHYTHPNVVWHPTHTMPSIKSMPPYIYVIDQDNNIERLNMSNCGELSASMPELVWDFLCKMHKIKFWAYPKDILPSEDDERGTNGTAL